MSNKMSFKNKKILAVIPARSGSKGLPGKNLRLLNGNPLIVYSIIAAQESSLINRIICTTDSDEIASIAKKAGAEIPFLRPPELAEDDSTDFDTFYHLLVQLKEKEDYVPDIVVQLRPTSPIRPPGFIDEGIKKLMSDSSFDSLRTVCPAFNSPYKMWTINENNDVLEPLLKIDNIPEPYNAPRQILPEVWWQTGTLDVMKSSIILNNKSMSGKNISFIKIDNQYAIDIDNINDFLEAEHILKEGKIECIKPI